MSKYDGGLDSADSCVVRMVAHRYWVATVQALRVDAKVRRAARTDESQSAIVERLRSIGVWVLHLHAIGKGCPDLLCWARGRAFLLEVKEPGERPNKMQAEFMARCPMELHIARSEEEAVRAALGEEALR